MLICWFPALCPRVYSKHSVHSYWVNLKEIHCKDRCSSFSQNAFLRLCLVNSYAYFKTL